MATLAESAPRRRYRGSSAEERRAQRREQFVRAAIRVYGERGYRNATVKAVCEAAALTERYFYESFRNSEELLVAGYRAVVHVLLKRLEQAGADAAGGPADKAAAILDAYYRALRDDPQSARLFLVEVAGVSPGVDQVLAGSLDRFGDLLARTLHGRAAAPADPLLRRGVVGGIVHIATHWVASGYGAPIGEVQGAALRLSLLLAGARRGAAEADDRAAIRSG